MRVERELRLHDAAGRHVVVRRGQLQQLVDQRAAQVVDDAKAGVGHAVVGDEGPDAAQHEHADDRERQPLGLLRIRILEALDDRHDHVRHDRVAGGDDDHADDRKRRTPTNRGGRSASGANTGGVRGSSRLRKALRVWWRQRRLRRVAPAAERIEWARIIAKGACRPRREAPAAIRSRDRRRRAAEALPASGGVGDRRGRGRRRGVRRARLRAVRDARFQQFLVQQHELQRHGRRRQRLDRAARVGAHAGCARSGIEQRAHVRGERGDVAGLAHQSGVVFLARARRRRTWCW